MHTCPSAGKGGCGCEDVDAFHAVRRGLAPLEVAAHTFRALVAEGVFGTCRMTGDRGMS